MIEPQIDWIKNDPKEDIFEDGSKFLIALQVQNHSPGYATLAWEFAILVVTADEDDVHFSYEDGDSYSAWDWEDVEYYAVLSGTKPINIRSSCKPND